MTSTIPARGWYVEIDDPDSDRTWRPDVVENPQINPSANDFQRIELPVRFNDRWTLERYLDADMRVWKDGERQPIGKLKSPGETVRSAQGQRLLTLNGRGGEELENRVQKEFDVIAVHEAAEQIINEFTSYQANVDAPPSNTETNKLLEEVDTDAELEDFFGIDTTDPLTVSNGELTTLQTAFHAEGEEIDSNNALSDADASEGQTASAFTAGNGGTVSFSNEYDIPDGEVGIATRYQIPNDPDDDGIYEGTDIDITINGSVVDSTSRSTNIEPAYRWQTSSANIGGLAAGSHTVGYEVPKDGESNSLYDLIVVYDQRFDYLFSDTVDANNLLAGPQTKPDLVEAVTSDVITAFQITGGRAEVTIDDTSNDQFIAVSNDQGNNYIRADNSTSVEGDFASGLTQLRAKLGLSRHGSRTSETPSTGFESQSVGVAKLFGDINRTPLIVNYDIDATVKTALNDLAELGYAFWEYRLDDGVESIEWTRPGQRTGTNDASASGYDWERTVEGRYERIVVKGGRQQARAEEITANHGTEVALSNGNIDHGTEAVYDPSTDDQFAEGDDYVLSTGVETDTGSIEALANGDISDGQALEIDYAYHPEGEWTADDASATPKTLIRRIPPVTTDRGCEQVAEQLGIQLDDPLEEAEIELSASEVGFTIVDAQAFADLPTDTQFDIREIATDAGTTTLRLGSRDSPQELISRIESRLESAANRT